MAEDKFANWISGRDKLNPFDMVISVLCRWGKEKPNSEISIDEVYNRFYKLSEKYPQEYDEFFFYQFGNGNFHSKLLEDVLTDAGAWGFTTMDSPRYKCIRFKATENVEKIITHRYSPEANKKLEEMAKYFLEIN